MWDKINPLLTQFPTAVLNAIDVSGQPFSLRCSPQANESANNFRIAPLPIELKSGTASLLFHKQGAYINDLKSFLLRGMLQITASEWVFTPTAFVPGIGIGNMFAQMSGTFANKRAARQYLAKRGIPYPKTDWAAIDKFMSNPDSTP